MDSSHFTLTCRCFLLALKLIYKQSYKQLLQALSRPSAKPSNVSESKQVNLKTHKHRAFNKNTNCLDGYNSVASIGHDSPALLSACPDCSAPQRCSGLYVSMYAFLELFKGLELVNRDVFFIDHGQILNLVNPPILNALMLHVRGLHDTQM